MTPKIYYSVEDGQEIILEEFYDLPEAAQCVEQTEEAEEIFASKGNRNDHELTGCYRIRESRDNKGAPE